MRRITNLRLPLPRLRLKRVSLQHQHPVIVSLPHVLNLFVQTSHLRRYPISILLTYFLEIVNFRLNGLLSPLGRLSDLSLRYLVSQILLEQPMTSSAFLFGIRLTFNLRIGRPRSNSRIPLAISYPIRCRILPLASFVRIDYILYLYPFWWINHRLEMFLHIQTIRLLLH